MAGQFRTAGIVPKHASRHQGLSFGSVAEDNLILLKQRGYICPSAEATGEAAIARIITGEIDFKELPRSKTRVKKYALQAGHNNVSVFKEEVVCCASMVLHTNPLILIKDFHTKPCQLINIDLITVT